MSSIKTLSSLPKADQQNIVQSIELSKLKMIVFPYKGNNATGVVYQNPNGSYLVVLDNYQTLSLKMRDLVFEDDEDDENETSDLDLDFPDTIEYDD